MSATVRTQAVTTKLPFLSDSYFSQCVFVLEGVAIAERLAPFKVKKFIYTDVAPRPELASLINAEYGKDARFKVILFPQSQFLNRRYFKM